MPLGCPERQTTLPDTYLRLNTGITATPLPLAARKVQREPAFHSYAPIARTRAEL